MHLALGVSLDAAMLHRQLAVFDVTAQGYPYSNTSQAGNVPTVSQDCEDVFVGLMQNPPSISNQAALAGVVGSATDFTTVRSGANCQYYYTAQNSGSGDTVPLFTYFSATGIVTQSTAVLP